MQLSDSIISVDTHHLKRIVSNFLSNAIKYTDAGSITVSTGEHQDECIIRVADTGVGIPEDKTDTLFEEFHRLESTRSRPGVGLGLALTKALAGLNGGRVWYEPNPEGGSVFSAAFKLLHSTERPALGVYIPRFNSVLVVDDDRAACRTNMRYLRGHANTLVPAQSFAQAYELALDLRPDLLVTDYNLGDGDGVRLLERLANADVSIPTVLISGSNGIPRLDSVIARFNVKVLEKPVDRESLIHAAAAVYAS